MKQIKVNTGLVSYRIGDGILQFNPLDPNLYARLSAAKEKLDGMERNFENMKDKPALTVLQEADREMKALLNEAFGAGNDFDKLLQGVSLLAIAPDGTTVLENLMNALEPVLVSGAKACAEQQASMAEQNAQKRRSAQ